MINEASARRKFKFGYPDGYGAAQYPPAYDAVFSSTTYLDYQFRTEQDDMSPPATAIADPAGDRAQAEYRKKMGVLPPHSGMESFRGFGERDGFDFVFFQSKPTGPNTMSFRAWLSKQKGKDTL